MTRAPHLALQDSVSDSVSQDEIAGNHNYHSSALPANPAPGSVGEETFVVPASLEQGRYWTLAQIDPGSTASNMAISFELAGPLDPLLVEQAIAALTLRHEALRTVFRILDGHLSQVILTRPLYEFTQQDLTRDGSVVPQAELAAVLSAHSHVSIDLEHGPVLRARLLRLASERHVLALTMSHIVCDGWSNGLLVRDLMKIYHALRTGAGPLEEVAAGPASGLPELPFQFADFTIWQNEYLATQRATDALHFWTSHIPRDLPALDMPADHPRQAGRSFPGTIASALLPASLNDALAAYCRKSGSTKHIVLLAVFEALCARFSGQRKFLLGSTIANRTQPGMEEIVGRFANPQIIVADVEGDPTFRELETRVRDWETSAYTHQDMPFSRIIEEFQMSQEGAGSQFLQVWFVYQRAFMQPQEIPGVRLTPLRSVSGGVDFDLLVSVVERAEGPRLQIEYNTDLFSAERIEALLAAFQQTLTGALAQPEQPISHIVLSPSVAHAASPVFSLSTAAPADLLDTIAAHAAARPEAMAVRAGTSHLSWRELEKRSHALAAHLRQQSFLSEATRALIVLTPEVDSAVALLALLRLGERGPRITPLPAHTTAEDLSSAISEASLLLTPGSLLREFPSSPARAIAYEEIAKVPSAPAVAESQPRFWAVPHIDDPEQIESEQSGAFVTKEVSFAETLRLVAALADRLHLSANDALFAVPPASSADALFDLLLAFHSGATLDLVAFRDDLPLQSLMDESQTTVAMAEPAQWRAWIASGWRGDRRLTLLARGRHIAHSGWMPGTVSEVIPVRSAITILSAISGPLAVATRDAKFAPLPGVTLSVLGPDGVPAPSGATGELAVAGSEHTGYLAQSTASTSFRVLGTSNSVVHLHGHRVRLSDLDAALLRAPGVLDATTRMQQREDGTPHLASWIVCHGALDTVELRRSLTTTLPQHLIPATLQLAPAFPFRLDGSVDAAQLNAAPETTSSSSAAPIADDTSLASDDVSRELSDIWKDVLHLDAVDPHRPFFDAGGNSLLLVRLFARLNKSFGTHLPITTIFDADTVAKLSERLRNHGEIRPIVPVQTHGHRPPVFMIHSYLLYRSLSQALGPAQPFYGLRELEADSALDMQERVANYVREIRAVQPYGPYSLMGWCAAGPLTMEVARHLIEAGETMGPVILFDSWLPGYLSSVEEVKTNGAAAPRWNRIRAKLQRHGEKMQGLSIRQRVQYVRNAVAHFTLNRRNRFFIRHWSTLNALANRFRVPLPQFMYNTTLTTFAALNAYRPQPVPIRLTLIRAHDAREVPGASAACGWEQVAMLGVEVLWAPGDHETMFLGDKLEATTELIRHCLQRPDANGMHAPADASAAARADSRLLRAGSL